MQEQPEHEKKREAFPPYAWLGIWIAIGGGLGVTMDNIALGAGIGAAIGAIMVAVQYALKKNKPQG